MAETTEQYRTRINQIKTNIEQEPEIRKMRDDIAEGVSKTGNRQADIEEQFQSVIDGTTGKDVISAPEIIAARNGETNLKTRLDKKEQEVTAQLAQTDMQLAENLAMQTGLLVFKGSATTSVITAKTGMINGDYWYSTDGLTYYAYNGVTWNNVGSSLTEVVDTRIGFDGESFINSGTAVRKQINELHNMEVGSKNVNFERMFEWEIGGILDTGFLYTATDKIRTKGFISGVNKFVVDLSRRTNGRWALHRYTQAGVWIGQVLSGSYLTEYTLDMAYKYKILYAFNDPITDYNIQASDFTFYKTFAPLTLQKGSVTLDKIDVDLAESLSFNRNTDGKFIHLSSDDVIDTFKDIYTNAYPSIFGNPALAFLKSMHDTYGMVFSCYCFFQTEDMSFKLSDMSNTYKTEFEECSDWLKFGAHYLDNNGGNFSTIDTTTGASYYTNIMTELFRICGTFKSLDFVPRFHNYAGTLDFIKAIKPLNLAPLGLITSEDVRQNYHLDTSINSYMQLHDNHFDYVNGLKLFSTDLRLENVTDVTTTLNGRKSDVAFSGRMNQLLLFTHELYLSQATMQTKIESACQWALANKYAFDFPQNYI